MSLHQINEIWKVLKPNLEEGNVSSEAAETLVSYMIDEDYSPDEIKHAFRGDKDIKDALEFYIESPDDHLYHEKDDDDDHWHHEDDDEW